MSRLRLPGPGIGAVRSLAAIVLAIAALAPAARPAAAAGVTFGDPAARPVYGESITFTVPLEHSGPLARVDLQLGFPGGLGPYVVSVPVTAAASQTATYTLDVSGGGHLVPNTTLEATWAAYPEIGKPPVLSSTETVKYADTDHDWQTLKGDVVTVHWYQGDQAFAERALDDRRQGREGHRPRCSASRTSARSTSSSTPTTTASARRSGPGPARTSAARRTRTSGRCSR